MFDQVRSGIREWRALGVGEEYFWRDARMVFADVPVDAAAVRDWLPFGLTLAAPARATLFIGDYPHTSFAGAYREAALLLHVKVFGLLPAVYCPWIVVDNDRALIIGRELLGFPKKMATIGFSEQDGQFTGSVMRHGTEVLRITGRIGAAVRKPPPGLGQRTVNVRGLLNAVLPAHLLMFRPRETVLECAALAAQVTLRSSADDPVGIANGAAFSTTIRTCDIGAGSLPLRIWPVHPLFAAHQMKLRVR